MGINNVSYLFIEFTGREKGFDLRIINKYISNENTQIYFSLLPTNSR